MFSIWFRKRYLGIFKSKISHSLWSVWFCFCFCYFFLFHNHCTCIPVVAPAFKNLRRVRTYYRWRNFYNVESEFWIFLRCILAHLPLSDLSGPFLTFLAPSMLYDSQKSNIMNAIAPEFLDHSRAFISENDWCRQILSLYEHQASPG